MCGVVGFLGGALARSGQAAPSMINAMTGCLRHRGPDAESAWHDAEAGIALGHTRLAIVDLSPAGAQPMESASGRHVIVFNGEIYNHLELRRELEAGGSQVTWRGHSDTESLLAAVETWGLAEALRRSIGMFALALWDRRDRTLFLARDRMGEKPLYYGWQGNGAERSLLFGSELKALRRHPAFEGEIERDSLAQFMRFNYVPAPRCIYRGMHKLRPGFIARIEAGAEQATLTPYWTAAEAIARGRSDPLTGSDQDILDSLEALLNDAIGLQMVADVPLGAFLSGGVDSSTVVALMQAQSARPVKTFSIGFHEKGYNEAEHAKAVAQHLGTDHTELYVTAEEAMAVIPALPAMYDEPFADSSQIPTHLVSRLARQHVTVSLSGDAGDELFSGYNRYLLSDKLWRRLSRVPQPLRRAAASALSGISPRAWNQLASAGKRVVPALGGYSNIGHKVHKGAAVLASADSTALYRGIVSHWMAPETLVLGGSEPPLEAWDEVSSVAGLSDVERMMAIDLVSYLPDDILAKVDRAAMAVSLETRVPFLDHRVVEFAWRLPLALKLREGKSKWPLRQVLYRHVPQALIERPKMGFGLPIDSWLRAPLRDWAETMLDAGRLRDQGFIDPAPVRRLWDVHLSGQADMQYHLWDVLMFQAWLESEENARSEPAPQPVRLRA